MRKVLAWFLWYRWQMRTWFVTYDYDGPNTVTRQDYRYMHEAMINTNMFGARHNRLIRNDMLRLIHRGYRMRFGDE